MPSVSPNELLQQGLDCQLALLKWTPGFESELVARVQDPEAGTENAAMGLLYLWSSLAFLEASVLSFEGILPSEFDSEDGWSSLDFLENLTWEEDRLRVQLSIIRGRQVQTDLWLSRRGLFVVRTQGRGDAPWHWFQSFKRH
ncbi:MAG: hypothetical protein RJB38_1299 [Pseudomonadota bacterium]|jgi:hypothetical protein